LPSVLACIVKLQCCISSPKAMTLTILF